MRIQESHLLSNGYEPFGLLVALSATMQVVIRPPAPHSTLLRVAEYEGGILGNRKGTLY